jgi:predicted alpha/beta-hydrolase family hydrolase
MTADAADDGVVRSVVDYATGSGPAILAVDLPPAARGVLVLGHGAGGDVDAADLLAVRDVALEAGLAVVRVRQPYRVAGRRAPAPAAQLDRAFTDVLDGVRAGQLPGLAAGLPVVVGGRSSGARVAARTAEGAVGVLALAFPLVPPGRTVSRVGELVGAGVRTLVVQGSRDAFGSAQDVRAAVAAAAAAALVEVVEITGADHSFRARRADGVTTRQCLEAVSEAVRAWLRPT